MRVLFLMEHLYPTIGGAEKSADTLIRYIRDKHPDIRVSHFCKNDTADELVDPVPLIANCDIVVTQLNWSAQVIAAAKHLGKKSVQFVRSYEGFCAISMDSFALAHCNQRCGPCPYRVVIEQAPNLLIANSIYTQKYLELEHNLPSEIVYPFVHFAEVKAAKHNPKYVTMNQRSYHKGADIFCKLARRFPEQQFRIVGSKSWMPHAQLPENVSYVGPMDPAEFYANTSVLLFPSRINDTFGRTIVEAQANGIPAIVSRRGACRFDRHVPSFLRIDDLEDIDLWESRLRWCLENYRDATALARSIDLSRFELRRNAEHFIELLKAL